MIYFNEDSSHIIGELYTFDAVLVNEILAYYLILKTQRAFLDEHSQVACDYIKCQISEDDFNSLPKDKLTQLKFLACGNLTPLTIGTTSELILDVRHLGIIC